MTDLEKFKELFDSIGIKYKENEAYIPEPYAEVIELEIDDSNLVGDEIFKGLTIEFYKNGKFRYFFPQGV